MTLITEAEKAEDIGDAFGKFKVAVGDQAAEVTALIAELYAVGSALREINNAILSSAECARNLRYVQDDLELVRDSLKFTLEDVFKILGRINHGNSNPSPAAYRQTWKEIILHFQQDGWGRLVSRMHKYKLFLQTLCSKIRR